MSESTEPQPVEFTTQAPFGAAQDYGADWVAYALNTEAPSFVAGVDPALNPQLGDADGGTAYA